MTTQSLSPVSNNASPAQKTIETTRWLVESRLSPDMPPGIHSESPAELIEAATKYQRTRDAYSEADADAYEAQQGLTSAAEKEGNDLRAAILADLPTDDLVDHTQAAERALRHAATKLQIRAGDVRSALATLQAAFSEHATLEADLFAALVPDAIEEHRAATEALTQAASRLSHVVGLVAYWRTGAGGKVDRDELMHARFEALGSYAVTSDFLSPEQRTYVRNMRNRDANIERLKQRRSGDSGLSE